MNPRWGFRTLLAPFTAVMAVAAAVGTIGHAAEGEPVRWRVPAVWVEALDGATVAVAGHGEHRGSIELRTHDGALVTVAHLRLEDYIAGLAEMPSAWPDAALEAQAIAARSYALNEVDRTVGPAWRQVADTCASEACQVYVGVEKERADHGERWVAAVQRTAGYVLLWDDRPIRAKYSSSNGGWSVAGGTPYLPSVEDPHDVYSPQHRWRSAIPADQVAASLGLPWNPTHAGKGGNVIALYHVDEATGESAEHRVEVNEFRSIMNATAPPPAGVPRPVPSIRFEATVADGSLVLDGVGFGHGIGMSQWGAYGKAIHGWSSPQILAAYYGGQQPVRWEGVPATIRVALAYGAGTTTVSGGPFRLVSGDGTVLATRATGPWAITRDASGVVVTAGTGARADFPGAAPGGVEAAAIDVEREAIDPPPREPFEIPAADAAAPDAPASSAGPGAAELGAALAMVVLTAGAVLMATRRGSSRSSGPARRR